MRVRELEDVFEKARAVRVALEVLGLVLREVRRIDLAIDVSRGELGMELKGIEEFGFVLQRFTTDRRGLIELQYTPVIPQPTRSPLMSLRNGRGYGS